MIRRLCTILPFLLIMLSALPAAGETFIPIPDFSEYEVPDTEHPDVASGEYEYLDLAALAVGLVLATFLALVVRSRRGLFLLAIVSLAWLGFWREGCICSIGAIQNVTLALFDPDYAIPTTVVVIFVLPLVFTLLFGRTFCAAVCPLGAIQELVARWPRRVPVWLEQALGLLAYVYLGAAVVFAATNTAFLICRYDPFVAFFRLQGSVNMLIFGGCFLLIAMFIGRPYCRFFCPYGVLLGWLSRLSKWHLAIPPQGCIQCRLCEDACPYGAIREPTVEQRSTDRRKGSFRLAMLIVLLPMLVAAGAVGGGWLRIPLAQMHPTVRLAERVRLEERMKEQVDELGKQSALSEDEAWEQVLDQFGQLEQTTDASDAFRKTGQSVDDLNKQAIALADRLRTAGRWLGAWIGLVIGAKLIHLSIRRRRTDYQPDRTGCVSCGRCFWYCPSEQQRQGLIQDIQIEPIETGQREKP